MRILIANDDGVYSPGLAALASLATEFGEVHVVAPDVEQSSSAQAITSSRPLHYRKVRAIAGVESWRVNGTPADCVALGSHMWPPDLVLSGINLGPNLGNAMWHSGTLAAARQAVLLGYRGIAISAIVNDETKEEPRFDALMPCVRRVLELLIPLEQLRLVNVNLPPEPRGITWTKEAVKQYDGKMVPGRDPMGREHYWFTVVPIERNDRGTDLWAVEHGYVSITPISVDLTDHAALAAMEGAHRLDPVIERGWAGRSDAVPESAEGTSVAPVTIDGAAAR